MSDIEKIKERIDIVDLIQGYIRLQKAGANFKARCPFHNEKTPSFYVSPERQIWHCFGCNLGGDVFGFIKQMEGLEFGEALRILAAKAGVELTGFDKELHTEKTRLLEICQLAAKFFEKQLHNSDFGKKALEYLIEDRGLALNTIKEWRLGFAPNSWSSLETFLRDAGYKPQEIHNAGLTVAKEKGEYYDRFRSRIIFPIFDLNDQIVGFTGRSSAERPSAEVDTRALSQPDGTLSQGEVSTESQHRDRDAKYINTPQTLIYDKSRVLYGLNKAKMEIKKANRGIAVEGNMDVIMSHQVGVKNVVASSGTALTTQHLKIIKRYTENLDLCFDADSAGESATRRGVDWALNEGLNVGIIRISDISFKDPADFIEIHGTKWQAEAKNSKPIVAFYFDKAFKDFDNSTALGKKQIANFILPLIKAVNNKIEKAYWISELSSRLHVSEAVLISVLQTLSEERPFSAPPASPDVMSRTSPDGTVGASGAEVEKQILQTDRNILEEAILSILFRQPALLKTLSHSPSFQDHLNARIFAALKEQPEFNLDKLLAFFSGDEKLKIEFTALKAKELWQEVAEPSLDNYLRLMVNKINKDDIIAQLNEINFQIKEAEKLAAKDKALVLMNQAKELGIQLAKYQ